MSGVLVIGRSMSQSPWARWTSEWQTPQALTAIRTSPGPGSGVGTSVNSIGPPISRSSAAFMLCSIASVVSLSPYYLVLWAWLGTLDHVLGCNRSAHAQL